MGMCLGLVSIDNESISRVLADPPLIWKVIAPDDPDMYEAERNNGKSTSWFSGIFGKKEARTSASLQVGPCVEDIDLDKAWHGIHYLFTKTAWEGDPPLNFLLLGGTEVGQVDVGYGTARAFTADMVAEIDLALAGLDRAYLERRFDPSEMTELGIYPEIWDRTDEEDDNFGYCAEYFDDLKAFVHRTTEHGRGMIIFLS